MAENKENLNLEDFLPYRLSVLSNTISRGIADLYAERFGLSIPAWRVMAVLGRFPGLSANEVAERTAMDKVAVSRAVAQLQKARLLVRKSAEEDRRRSVLALTDKGWSIHAEVAPLALEMERELLSPLTGEERAMLDALITKLTECARTLSPGQSEEAKKDYGAVL
jgi:DNA-binding MarR family transcriptional regulator